MSDRPNIVLVTVDSLRADHCGFMGYEKDTTPTLDAMAEEGVVFENAIAPGPSTPESMPAIFTGEYPVERRRQSGSSELTARREGIKAHMGARATLAERLQLRGYETAAFTPNPFTSRHFGFDAGFDHFEDFMDESTRGRLYQKIFQGFVEGSGLASMARVLLNFWNREEVFKPWESYYDEVRRWATQAEKPYFLWVFLMDAHNPYIAPSRFRNQSRWKQFHANFEFWRQSHETPFSDTVHERLVTAYDDAIRYCDAFLGRLLADVDTDESVVAVHGDHGEAFGEHGFYGHEPYLYPEDVHVPLVSAGGDLPATNFEEPASLRSLPQLLERIAATAGNWDDGPDGTSCTDRVVITRTRDGDRTALYVDGMAIIQESNDKRNMVHSESGGEMSPETTAVWTALLKRICVQESELQAIETATEFQSEAQL